MIEQEACAAVLMRLEDADESFGFLGQSKRLQVLFDLGRMMSVVVVDHDGSTIGGAPLAKSLHATIETVEGGHRLGRLVPFGPELMGEDHGARH